MGQIDNHKLFFYFVLLGCKSFAVILDIDIRISTTTCGSWGKELLMYDWEWNCFPFIHWQSVWGNIIGSHSAKHLISNVTELHSAVTLPRISKPSLSWIQDSTNSRILSSSTTNPPIPYLKRGSTTQSATPKLLSLTAKQYRSDVSAMTVPANPEILGTQGGSCRPTEPWDRGAFWLRWWLRPG